MDINLKVNATNLVVNLISENPKDCSDSSESNESSSHTESGTDADRRDDTSDNSSLQLLSSSSDDDGSLADMSFVTTVYRILIHGKRRVHVEQFLNTVHSYSHAEFKEHLRLDRATAYRLIDDLHDSGFVPTHANGVQKISAELSFLMFLWYLGNTEPYRTLSDRFDMSISSVFRVLRRFVTWLLSLSQDKIKWPQGVDILRVSQGFQRKRGLRGCIGAIDGTHITIRCPVVDPESYCNRKKYYSIILQAVVDSDMRFTHAYCGEPGSLHDARVLRRSDLAHAAEENREVMFPNNTYLLGDSAYPSLPWLVPPFRNRLNAQRNEFNFLHSSTRMAVEKAFGILKGRFRRLKFVDFLDIDFVPKLVVACCLLHNICLENGDDCNAEVLVDDDLSPEGEEAGDRDGVIDRRQLLFDELFSQ